MILHPCFTIKVWLKLVISLNLIPYLPLDLHSLCCLAQWTLIWLPLDPHQNLAISIWMLSHILIGILNTLMAYASIAGAIVLKTNSLPLFENSLLC